MRLLIEPFLLIRHAPQYLGRILAMNHQRPRQEHATHSPETLWVSHAAMAPSRMTGFAADLWQEHAEAEAPLRRVATTAGQSSSRRLPPVLCSLPPYQSDRVTVMGDRLSPSLLRRSGCF